MWMVGEQERPRPHRSVRLAVVAAALVVTACGSTEPAEAGIDGQYPAFWTRANAICSPQELPPPLTGDTSEFDQVPVNSRMTLTMQLVQTGDSVAIYPAAGSSADQKTLTLHGLSPAGSFLLSLDRTLNRTEAPRVGGHTFSVTETLADSGTLLSTRTIPDGHIITDFSVRGLETAVFRDNGPMGPVFTTCVAADTIVGER